jgi:hypothetical protein
MMSEQLYTFVSTGHKTVDQHEGDPTTWVMAEIYLNGCVVATGLAPERPPYVEGTARSSAISRAQIAFAIEVLPKDIRDADGATFKNVKGTS